MTQLKTLRLVIVLFAALAGAGVAHADCTSRLPIALTRQLTSDAPAWRLLERADLSETDQELWRSAKRSNCPGIAQANFDGSGRRQVFLLLTNADRSQARLVLYVRNEKRGFEKKLDFGPDPAPRLPVISIGPPGRYEERLPEGGRGRTIAAKHPVLVWALLESVATATYFDGQTWQEITIAD